MTTVSAIVPTFNRAPTLGRALASVFAQTRAPDEVIVVDDGSTDDTGEVLKRFPQARVLRLAQNRGAAAARNEGIRQARGEYLAFLDSDDEWAPRKLQVQLEQAGARPAVDLLCTGITVHRRDGSITQHRQAGASGGSAWAFEHFLDYPFSPSTWLVKSVVFAGGRRFDESLPNCEDLDLLARIAGACAIEVMPELLAIKHNRRDSLDADPARRSASLALLVERYGDRWSPASVAATWQRLANLHFDGGDARAGRAALRAALARRPASARLWALLLLSAPGPAFYNRVRGAVASLRALR